MKNNSRFIFKHSIIAQFLLGVVIMSAAAFLAIQSDMDMTQRVLSATTGYIKEQCNRYARIELAAETKSLMRIIESCKQISHQLDEDNGYSSEEALAKYAQSSYVSGIILLDSDGNILSQYHTEGSMPEPITEALQSSALKDIADYPEKRYAVRLHCADQSEIDLAAMPRLDEGGIVISYYHTPLEYIESFNLSIASLLSGYNMSNNGTIVVSQGDTIVASNDTALVGRSTNDLSILRKIKTAAVGNRLTHTGQNESPVNQYFGLMARGRDFYVYTFLPERSVFSNTPRTLIYTFIAYILILLCFSVIRWRTAQRAQAEFSSYLQSKNEQLSEAVQEADRANAAKTSFLSRMSHDIRTPLNGIIGLLEIDAAHPENMELINDNRKKMQIAADHLLSLINDVLQMSKLESGEITLAHEPVDLHQLGVEVFTIISQRAAESGITMEHDSSSDPLCIQWVYGSPLHLRQIFLNIFTNCVKYNKIGGSISVLFQCVGSTDKTVTYRWTITDTGIGMSEDFLQHIFDPFTQENTDARSVYQGTGLGMTIVKGLIEQMHGSIEVKSREGIGSSFTLTIPFEIADPAAVSAVQEVIIKEADISGLHLLLAEDNTLNAEIAKILLEDAGAIVTIVDNGQQALKLFEEKPSGTFDAILMDMMMPVMDGLTATQNIRKLNHTDAKNIPIIAMTANAFAEDADKCIAAGMNVHLAKPLEMDKIKQTIHEQVKLSSRKKA